MSEAGFREKRRQKLLTEKYFELNCIDIGFSIKNNESVIAEERKKSESAPSSYGSVGGRRSGFADALGCWLGGGFAAGGAGLGLAPVAAADLAAALVGFGARLGAAIGHEAGDGGLLVAR